MKSVYKITLRTMLRKKVRSLLILFSIIMATILLIGSFSLKDSYAAFESESNIYQEGDWQYQTHVNATQYHTFASMANDHDWIAIQDQMVLEDTKKTSNLYLKGTSKLSKALPLHLIQGKEPIHDDEVMIPLRMAKIYNLEIGQTVSYNAIENPVSNHANDSQGKAKMTWVITGIIEDLSDTAKESDGFVLYTVMDDEFDSQIFLGKDTLDEEMRNDLKRQSDIPFVKRNRFTQTNSSIGMITSSLQWGLGILIAFFMMMTIRSIFMVSLHDKMQYFSKLKALGATTKQIKKMIYFEAFFYLIVGLPIGILLSNFAGGIITNILDPTVKAIFMTNLSFVIIISMKTILLSSLLVCIAVMLSLHPFFKEVEQRMDHPLQQQLTLPRQNKNQTYRKRLLHRYAYTQKKRTRMLYASISLSVLLFLGTHVFLQSSMQNDIMEKKFNVQVQVLIKNETESFVDYQKRVEALIQCEASGTYTLQYVLGLNGLLDQKDVTREYMKYSNEEPSIQFFAVDKDWQKQLSQTYNLSMEREESYILFRKVTNDMKEVINTTVFTEQKEISYQFMKNDGSSVTHTLPITHVVDDINPFQSDSVAILTTQQQLQKLIDAYGSEHLMNYGKDATIYFHSDDPYTLEKHIEALDTNTLIINQTRDRELYNGMLRIFRSCMDIFAGLLFLTSISNIINLLISNVKERERDYASLIALGLTSAQLRSMVRYENGRYLALSFLIGSSGGAAFAILLQLANHQPLISLLKLLLPAVILLGILFLILWFVLCQLVIKRIQKLNILRLLKTN